jgi:RNA-directed DNA polymerase
VRSLQRLLANSLAAKLLAVQRVSSNRVKNTPGVDGVLLNTPARKWRQAHRLNAKDYRPTPLRRIYIPKKNGKRRPLGIPVHADRPEQAVELPALDPVSETLADPCTCGFRKARGAHDVISGCFLALCRRNCAEWILEGEPDAPVLQLCEGALDVCRRESARGPDPLRRQGTRLVSVSVGRIGQQDDGG